ncbi:hypothetical protein TDB9533_00596 [Thalassocella blandensis]|nr:hypothetical protein TDB9533_00596 [Thalassocella blandensis]
MKLFAFIVILFSTLTSGKVLSDDQTTQQQLTAKNKADERKESELDQFGFGPALYVIHYKEEVLEDTNDVSIRGDQTITATGTQYATSIGLELHYDFSFARTLKCFNDCDNSDNWNLSSGHRISPFLGIYDLSDGFNGIAAGLVYGYWKGDKDESAKTTLNAGLGWTVHKNRLVLSKGLHEGSIPDPSLNFEDYTERKDVEGLVLMISVNVGF